MFLKLDQFMLISWFAIQAKQGAPREALNARLRPELFPEKTTKCAEENNREDVSSGRPKSFWVWDFWVHAEAHAAAHAESKHSAGFQNQKITGGSFPHHHLEDGHFSEPLPHFTASLGKGGCGGCGGCRIETAISHRWWQHVFQHQTLVPL